MSELNLEHVDHLDRVSLHALKASLDKLFGAGAWKDWEPETISIELGVVFSSLLLDKLRVLQILENDKGMFYEDPLFFLYATEVINNESADFEVTPVPTSLEIAYAVTEVESLYPGTFSNGVKRVMTYMLNEEGYSVPVGIFSGLVDPKDLAEGQTEEDTRDKELAIKMYISGMKNAKH